MTETPRSADELLQGLNPEHLLQQGLPGSEPTGEHHSAGRFTPPSAEELNALLPQFEILELLGQGGMGAVYKARQSTLDRPVAVKILPPQIGRDPSFAERFAREAKALARLSHPNIVSVHDAGAVDLPNGSGKLYFIAMEFVDGVSLRQVIREGKLPSDEALAIVPQICDALQYAHDTGVVHRDIKPDNILLDARGRVKIADFGLAKLLDAAVDDVTLTATHQVMGTLRYMAPEQMEATKTVDHRADIYSLGVVFYELLTGDVPAGRISPPSRKVQIDVRLDEVVLRALEREPEQRWQNASDVRSEVDGIVRSAPRRSIPQGKPAADGLVWRRMTVFTILGFLAADGVLGVLTAGYLSKATWYFKQELPYTYLSTGLMCLCCMCCAWLTYWWYLLAKDPDLTRSFDDFWKRLQTPDPRMIRIWLPLVIWFAVWQTAVISTMVMSKNDDLHTFAMTIPLMLLPFVVMFALWRAYEPWKRRDFNSPPARVPAAK